MKYTNSLIQRVKNIALVAHDNKKNDLVEWAQWNKPVLQRHNIFATGTTGQLMEAELEMAITKFQSGPLGGDGEQTLIRIYRIYKNFMNSLDYSVNAS